jgi:CRISPR/Cas system-associated exonuclease Cas4 (RecB family)
LVETRAGLHASAIISSDSEFCYRAQLLSLFYEQAQGQNLPVKLLKIFAAGTSIHEKWQNMFEKGGICIKNEARSFSEKYDLYFTPDSIVEIGGKIYVCEIKSMNTFSFLKATSHPSGQKQCLLYMHLLGIENGFVLAEDKNNQEIKIFPVEYDYMKVAPFLDRLNEIQEMKKAFIEDKAVPPRKCGSSTCKAAEACNMHDVCWGSSSTRKTLRLKYGR